MQRNPALLTCNSPIWRYVTNDTKPTVPIPRDIEKATYLKPFKTKKIPQLLLLLPTSLEDYTANRRQNKNPTWRHHHHRHTPRIPCSIQHWQLQRPQDTASTNQHPDKTQKLQHRQRKHQYTFTSCCTLPRRQLRWNTTALPQYRPKPHQHLRWHSHERHQRPPRRDGHTITDRKIPYFDTQTPSCLNTDNTTQTTQHYSTDKHTTRNAIAVFISVRHGKILKGSTLLTTQAHLLQVNYPRYTQPTKKDQMQTTKDQCSQKMPFQTKTTPIRRRHIIIRRYIKRLLPIQTPVLKVCPFNYFDSLPYGHVGICCYASTLCQCLMQKHSDSICQS